MNADVFVASLRTIAAERAAEQARAREMLHAALDLIHAQQIALDSERAQRRRFFARVFREDAHAD